MSKPWQKCIRPHCLVTINPAAIFIICALLAQATFQQIVHRRNGFIFSVLAISGVMSGCLDKCSCPDWEIWNTVRERRNFLSSVVAGALVCVCVCVCLHCLLILLSDAELFNKKLSCRRETARQLPTWRGLSVPSVKRTLSWIAHSRSFKVILICADRNPERCIVVMSN